ncbi:hypothetical protein BDP27DRAFT_1251619, partial [Rhodocollybia butyracea]
ITTVRKDGRIEKHIRWSAFKFSAQDWNHVADCKAILEYVHSICFLCGTISFYKGHQPYPAALFGEQEYLLTQWENKLVDPHFELYHPALEAGLAKFRKYYEKFDEKPAYILSLFIHPYYKLNWIELHWGGADAQAEAIAGGDGYAQNWMDEAEKLVEATVCACLFFSGLFSSQSAG